MRVLLCTRVLVSVGLAFVFLMCLSCRGRGDGCVWGFGWPRTLVCAKYRAAALETYREVA